MAIPNFRELLSKPTNEVDRPRALAAGHYIGELTTHEFGVSRQKQTPFVRFNVKLIEEASDVENGANKGIDLSRRELRRDFFITPQALYRLSDFLDAVLGKQVGRPFDQRIPETRGVRVMVQVTRREVTDDEGTVLETYNDVGTIIAHN